MITAVFPNIPGVLLLAPVRGLTSEVPRLLRALEEFAPVQLGLGLSSGELQSLHNYFVASEGDPVVSLTENETSEVRGLVRFGEVRVPNPSFVESLRWAETRGIPAVPLDPDDDHTAALFAQHIGYVELVRRTVRERRVSRSPPTPSSADEFALEWDREVAAGRGSRSFAAARDSYLARQVSSLAAWRPLAVVVDRERFDSVRQMILEPSLAAPK